MMPLKHLKERQAAQFKSLNQLPTNQQENQEKSFMTKYVEILKKNANGTIVTLTKIINILKLHQLLRNQKQLEILKEYFDQNFPYIGKLKDRLDDNKCLDLYRHMNVEKYKSLTTIFRQGEPGRKMYFLLQGEVGIFVPKTKSSQEVQNLICHDFKDVIEIQFCEFSLVAVKGFGQVFGEIAIEQRVTRTATVVAKTDVMVALLSYEMFQNVIGKYQNEITEKKLQFINTLPLFKNWDIKQKLIALSAFEQQKVYAGQLIFSKGKLDENVYLVIEGEIQIIQWASVKSNLTINNIQKQKTMAIINTGQFFGDYEHIMGFNERVTSAKARMETLYYRIKYSLLIDLLDMYSNVEQFKKDQLTKFQIQSSLMCKIDEWKSKTEHTDPEFKINIEQIKQSYFKQLKVEKTINELKKKVYLTEDQHYKEHYKNQIEKLSKTLSVYDTIQSNKYSSVVPNKMNPYQNDENLISSPNRNKTINFTSDNEDKHQDKGIERFIINKQRYHLTKKYMKQKVAQGQNTSDQNQSQNSLSLSKIILEKIQKLNLKTSYNNLQKTKSGDDSIQQQSLTVKSYYHDNLSTIRSYNLKRKCSRIRIPKSLKSN